MELTRTKKPQHLFRTSLYRAKFFELLTNASTAKPSTSEAYLCGMLSLIDGLLDCELHSIVGQLNLSHSIKHSLTEKVGDLGWLLRLSEALETGDWPVVESAEKALGIAHSVTIECDLNAHLWLHELSS